MTSLHTRRHAQGHIQEGGPIPLKAKEAPTHQGWFLLLAHALIYVHRSGAGKAYRQWENKLSSYAQLLSTLTEGTIQ